MESFFTVKEKQAVDYLKKAVTVQNSLFLIKKTRAGELKIIISVRKKLFKKASLRNRIKRQIREIIRKDVAGNYQKMFYLIIVSKFYDHSLPFEKKRRKLLELL